MANLRIARSTRGLPIRRRNPIGYDNVSGRNRPRSYDAAAPRFAVLDAPAMIRPEILAGRCQQLRALGLVREMSSQCDGNRW